MRKDHMRVIAVALLMIGMGCDGESAPPERRPGRQQSLRKPRNKGKQQKPG